ISRRGFWPEVGPGTHSLLRSRNMIWESVSYEDGVPGSSRRDVSYYGERDPYDLGDDDENEDEEYDDEDEEDDEFGDDEEDDDDYDDDDDDLEEEGEGEEEERYYSDPS